MWRAAFGKGGEAHNRLRVLALCLERRGWLHSRANLGLFVDLGLWSQADGLRLLGDFRLRLLAGYLGVLVETNSPGCPRDLGVLGELWLRPLARRDALLRRLGLHHGSLHLRVLAHHGVERLPDADGLNGNEQGHRHEHTHTGIGMA